MVGYSRVLHLKTSVYSQIHMGYEALSIGRVLVSSAQLMTRIDAVKRHMMQTSAVFTVREGIHPHG